MDPVKEFFNDLRSPDPSIRFSVLSRIEDLEWNEQQRHALKSLIAKEQDPGIRFHMLKVLARFDQTEDNKATVEEIEALLKEPEKDEIALALMLESVKRKDAPKVVSCLEKVNWPEFSDYVLPSVLKFLKKYANQSSGPVIEMLCSHPDPRVCSSAIETLEKIAPDRLKKHIVPLLLNKNLGIRSRAVKLLHRWDPSEALRHFEAMLFSEDKNEKQAAMFQAYFFPFNQIEHLMLRFISVENDADLIKKAGLLFMTNPDGRMPARLLEARQASGGEKYKLIDKILKGVLISLYQAKIVKATPEQMIEVLENHFRKKRLKLFIERYSLGLKSGAPETRLKSVAKLCDLVRYGIEEACPIVEEYLGKEKDAEIKSRALKLFSACQPETVEKQVAQTEQKTEREIFAELLNSADKESFPEFIKLAEKFYSDLESSEKLQVLKIIERLGSKNDSRIPERSLKSENSEILAGAIDCLSVIEPDSLTPFLPQLIKHRSPEVREAAIKVFALFDKQQAIALVEKMLFSVQPMQRRQAIHCCTHFDFQSVRHLLVRALKLEGDPENQQQLCFLLRSNADEELFYRIYSDWKSCKTTKQKVYEQLCHEMADILAEGEAKLSKEVLFKNAIRKLEEEEEIKSQRQAYKLEKIQEIRKDNNQSFKIDASLARFTLMAYLIGAIATAGIWFLFIAPSPSSGGKSEVGGKSKKVQLKNAVVIRGNVIAVNSEKREVTIVNTLENNKKYMIKISENYGDLPETGDVFNAQVKPLGLGPVVKAELLTVF
ncbi:MAG: HEAT repeat domain-containing protein [Candidatus Rifleibacteriota bacterium]